MALLDVKPTRPLDARASPESLTATGEPANALFALKPEAATKAAMAAARVRGRSELDFISASCKAFKTETARALISEREVNDWVVIKARAAAPPAIFAVGHYSAMGGGVYECCGR